MSPISINTKEVFLYSSLIIVPSMVKKGDSYRTLLRKQANKRRKDET
uniref:Uncharacterized protein n=1 Tax=Utricularia reniformis TaxID=192314 RepID=A0A1Y0B4V2_9LAMI|nr:hypothetical protein AEK19_MT2272 [Utricularia reniformis]ART32417.1 hypothetical protein AEK19_MT2272 [Utricularia reniformis]